MWCIKGTSHFNYQKWRPWTSKFCGRIHVTANGLGEFSLVLGFQHFNDHPPILHAFGLLVYKLVSWLVAGLQLLTCLDGLDGQRKHPIKLPFLSHLKYSAIGPHSFNFRNAVFPCFVPIVISLQHGSQSFRLPASFIPSLKSSVVTTFSFLHSLMAQAPHFRHISKLNPPLLWLDGKDHLCVSSCCEIPTITQPF